MSKTTRALALSPSYPPPRQASPLAGFALTLMIVGFAVGIMVGAMIGPRWSERCDGATDIIACLIAHS
jgi:hypothetical protein